LVEFNYVVEDYFIEVFFLEEKGSTQTENILLVGNKWIFTSLSFAKGSQMVVIDDGFFEDDHELVDAVDEVGHALSVD
jgi:hypothetical protein